MHSNDIDTKSIIYTDFSVVNQALGSFHNIRLLQHLTSTWKELNYGFLGQ